MSAGRQCVVGSRLFSTAAGLWRSQFRKTSSRRSQACGVRACKQVHACVVEAFKVDQPAKYCTLLSLAPVTARAGGGHWRGAA